MFLGFRDFKYIGGIGVKPVFTNGRDDHGGCFVGTENGRILDDVAENAFPCPGGTDNDQGFAGEINMFFILNKIR